LDMYLEALKEFPDTSVNLHTQKGEAVFQKMDIFKGKLWYAYREGGTDWVAMNVDKANEIVALNKLDKKPAALEDFMDVEETVAAPSYESAIEQDSITRFDQKKSRGRKKKGKRGKPGNNPQAKTQGQNQGQNQPKGGNKPKRKPRKVRGDNPKGEGTKGRNGQNQNKKPERPNDKKGES